MSGNSKFALLLGNGDYARELWEKLHLRGEFSSRVYSLFPARLSDFSDGQVQGRVDLSNRGSLYKELNRHDLSHVVFAGRFRLSDLVKRMWLRKSGREVIKALVRYRSVSNMLNQLGKEFAAHDLSFLHVGELISDYKLGLGEKTGIGLTTAERALLDVQVPMTVAALKNQPRMEVCQSVLMDNLRISAIERRGTDHMLQRVKPKQTRDHMRCFIKLSTEAFDTRFDAPVIGLRTIELAIAAGVDMIAFDADKGVVMHKVRVIDRCRAANIKLIGVRPNRSLNAV